MWMHSCPGGVLNVDPKTELSWASFYLNTWGLHTRGPLGAKEHYSRSGITAGSFQSRQCGRAAGSVRVQPVLLKLADKHVCLDVGYGGWRSQCWPGSNRDGSAVRAAHDRVLGRDGGDAPQLELLRHQREGVVIAGIVGVLGGRTALREERSGVGHRQSRFWRRDSGGWWEKVGGQGVLVWKQQLA